MREARTVPFSALDDDAPAVAADRFQGEGEPHPGGWRAFPQTWAGLPEERLVAHETHALIERTIEGLPDAQRAVITLRDIDGLDAQEICNVLSISETNQRVLLHRARARVRTALESYFAEGAL